MTTNIRTLNFYPFKHINHLLLLISLFIFNFPIPANAVPSSGDSTYIDYLLDLASQKNLHEQRYWRVLLHYKQTPFGVKSLIDDPDFFLCTEGKINPKAELEESIRSFFGKNNGKSDFQICQYIARYTWLKQELEVDESITPIYRCEELDHLTPKSATLIFPTYYMNSPASMFGHTLINIETFYSSKLLTNSVNYSAFTGETNGCVFAFKGIFGLYKGYFSILPYYKKIQEYSDISQRDIWEYRLNLSEKEVQRMVLHIRELQNIYSDYFFFDENCSYNLLFLIEAARPSLDLTGNFHLNTIPVDTVKVIERAGIIDSVEYRPSKASKIRQKISLLNAKEQEIALNIINRERPPEYIHEHDLSRENKIIIIDLIIEYVGYLYSKKKLDQSEYQKIFLSSLSLRSKLGTIDKDKIYSVPKPPMPNTVHDSNRLGIGFGNSRDLSFYEMIYRPAFCDLLDTDYGKNNGVQIKFFDLRFRYYPSRHRLELDNADIIDIISISSRDRFFKPVSWKVNFSAGKEFMEDEAGLVYRLNTGGGLGYYNDYIGRYYILAGPDLEYSNGLDKDYALGAALFLGTVKELSPWWKCSLSASHSTFEYGDRHKSDRISLEQDFKLEKNQHLRLELTREKNFDIYNTETKLSLNFYF